MFASIILGFKHRFDMDLITGENAWIEFCEFNLNRLATQAGN